MIVVSDSTPLIHFAKVEHIELLFSLYKEQAGSILNKFKENPQIFWIEPNIIKSAIEKIYNNKS